VRIISLRPLRTFWEVHPRAEEPLRAWYQHVSKAVWKTPSDVRTDYRTADFVGDRVVFNIAGNHFRLVAYVAYTRGLVYVKFIGTHAQYDAIDVRRVDR
jgi:mRNA interferase HigB